MMSQSLVTILSRLAQAPIEYLVTSHKVQIGEGGMPRGNFPLRDRLRLPLIAGGLLVA